MVFEFFLKAPFDLSQYLKHWYWNKYQF